ncbi:Oidioi.mRNA.OKI2018_I69.PAR.g8536.t1.cds [Oikopleura dioica]|uniref:Oidioi.mRNA.OKI2018_I69.PAR.g8536.t1.cds n=1 Tax=Oikopleura dioica TaxID=34765 RepID=A0ABN7RGH8_OIKDI|nr:Oidioi.mRNA.OKI2018_I69.PAR.g8536.t1.cds [Oikopleura dioica]
MERTHRTVHWFRKGLRLHDNEALYHAVTTSQVVFPIYIVDVSWQKEKEKFSAIKTRFLIDCLKDLDEGLKKCGTRLYVLTGDATQVIKKFCKENEITQMTWMKDAEIFYRERDEEITKVVHRMEIKTKSFLGHTLYDPDEVIAKNGGKIPLTMEEFYETINDMEQPGAPCPTVTAKHFKNCLPRAVENHDSLYGIPKIAAWGHSAPRSLTIYKGGERQALKVLKAKMADSTLFTLNGFNQGVKTKLPHTTYLSPYQNYGCISTRFFWKSAEKLPAEKTIILRGQMIYREFFYVAASQVNNFTKMTGNRICRQIDWYENADHLKAWKEGKTGLKNGPKFSPVSLVMRQLVTEGFIHHINRWAVASFLTNGQLWLNWEHGQQMFEEHQIDGDYAMNAGCWMWCTGSAFKEKISESTLDPVKFARRWDPEGHFTRKYCPELKNMPLKYLFCPWEAPENTQRHARVQVGIDYPAPIVDYKKTRSQNLEQIRKINLSESISAQ